jgi:ubiquinone biosynthesis protein UbiJ
MQLPASAITGLEAVINRYLRLDPDIGPRLAALSGRCIAIELRGLDLTLFIFPNEHGIQLKDHIEGEADTVLRGTPLSMARLGLGGNTEKTLFSGEVVIEGDVETGQAFKSILDGLDIDWEEQLSRLTGDVIAHQLGNTARLGRRVFRHGLATLEKDLGEYLQEELRVLPSRIETENFSADVTHISMAVDRLTARLKRLQSQAHKGVDGQ